MLRMMMILAQWNMYRGSLRCLAYYARRIGSLWLRSAPCPVAQDELPPCPILRFG